MLNLLKRPALAAALVGSTSIAALVGGAVSETQAQTYAYYGPPRVVISAPVPVPVFGFSYGNPYFYGHVHYSPVSCSYGPTYYRYPAHRYYGYGRPVVGHVRRQHGHYLPPHAQFIRNRMQSHLDHLRGDW